MHNWDRRAREHRLLIKNSAPATREEKPNSPRIVMISVEPLDSSEEDSQPLIAKKSHAHSSYEKHGVFSS